MEVIMTEVAAAFIKRDDKILICRRPEGKNCALLWEFPGGKLESGETTGEALARECLEELGIVINPGRILADTIQEYPSHSIHLTLMEASIERGEPQCIEHSELSWVRRDELSGYDLCPADKRLLIKLGILNEGK